METRTARVFNNKHSPAVRILGKVNVLVRSLAAEQPFDRLQADVPALEARHPAIREANAALLPATLARIFQSEATA